MHNHHIMAKRKKKRTRRLIFVLVGGVIVVLILGLVASRFMDPNSGGESVEVTEAQIRTITQVVTASGRVQPEVEIVISPDVSGEIVELPVIEGQQVQRGQLLARIKPDYYVARVEQAEANLKQAHAQKAQRQADMLLKRVELERQRQLFEAKHIAEVEYQQTNTQYEIAQSSLDAAVYSVQSSEALLREAKEELNKTALYAPMSGTISKLEVELGERVTGNELQAGTSVMTIARLDQMELEVEVSENDVVNVALGDTASIEVDAYPERAFKGVITEIANSARLQGSSFQEQVTNFPVKVRILDPHNAGAWVEAGSSAGLVGETPPAEDFPSFRPGMSGTVDIYTNTVPDVVSVPIQSVTVRDFTTIRRQRARRAASSQDSTSVRDSRKDEAAENEGGREDLRKMVFVVDGENKARATVVETGIADDRFFEIKSGLAEGDRIVTGPYSAVSRTLEDGELIRERNRFGTADQ